jgi:hypothetical protein
MKFIFSICAAFGLSVSALATGSLQNNSTLTGITSITNGGSQSVTNTFQTPFSYPPSLSTFLIGGYTNALPFTNTVTTTNFIIVTASSTGAGTNATIAWTANPAATQIQWGSQVVNASLPSTNVTFPTAFIYAPNVMVSAGILGAATNAYPAVTAVTTTGFTLGAGAQTVYWQATGYTATRAITGPNGDYGTVTH